MTVVARREPTGLAVIRTEAPHGGTTPALVNWSRWIANCPGWYCRGATDLDYGQTWTVCAEPWCRTRAAVVWPANVPDIEYLLSLRPDPTTRNWEPGETVHDLLAENIEHGILPPSWLESAGTVLALAGDRIVGGSAAPAGFALREIGA